MSDRSWDLVMFWVVISWPFLLGLGIYLWLIEVPWWGFFVFYCITSSPGIARSAIELWRHGIHNDR